MLVIEGRVGKSLKLQEIINKHDGKVLMLDAVGVNFMQGDNLFVIPISLETLWATNFINDYIDEIREYNLIVFETNDNKEMINNYRQLENLIDIKCIVTIQNNSLENIKIYETWLKELI